MTPVTDRPHSAAQNEDVSFGPSVRKAVRRATLVAVAATFAVAQSGWAASLSAGSHCAAMSAPAGMQEPAGPAMEHACCGGMISMDACAMHPIRSEAGRPCCRLEQERRVPGPTSSAKTDRSEPATPKPGIALLPEFPLTVRTLPVPTAHVPPVLDQKADLRI